MENNNNMEKVRQNKNLKGPEARKHVNLFDAQEVKYYATKFGVTQEDIEEAIYMVGDKIENIKTFLNKK
ncbi:DUF3606 domain-containing protein [Cytophagaceae bacterium ABcell3]|nr:DUF3606 domain-containing protein [Cytophagaceae bacterium ABcell3]